MNAKRKNRIGSSNQRHPDIYTEDDPASADIESGAELPLSETVGDEGGGGISSGGMPGSTSGSGVRSETQE